MRELSRRQLREAAAEIAASPSLWESRVRHDPNQRIFEQLSLDERLGVWLICWMEGHDTGFHDHDGSSGAVAVVRGNLREERLHVGSPASAVELGAGDIFDFGPTEIHRVLHPGGEPAVTIHAYSPPLRGMGSYVLEASGALRREALGHSQELRPLVPLP